jgi:hypothetical protein
MPLPEAASILHPETFLLKWAGVPRLSDVGQFCYLLRDTSKRQRKNHKFDLDSLSAERVKAVRKLVLYLSDIVRLGAQRPFTLVSRVRDLTQFMNWSDSRGFHDVLCQEKATQDALHPYFDALREDVSQGKRNQNGVANSQSALLSLLCDFFENQSLGCGLRRMHGGRKYVTHTTVPEEGTTGPFLAWAKLLFVAVAERTELLHVYPIEMAASSGSVWLFPTQSRRGRRATSELDAWDSRTGELLSANAVADIYLTKGIGAPKHIARKMVRRAERKLKSTNSSLVNEVRLSHAVAASYSFASLFLAETGINLTQLLQVEWSPELEAALQSPAVVRQQFREIKYRAGGRSISFRVSIGFVPQLKLYLRLREYLCRGLHVDKLLVAHGVDRKPTGLPDDFMSHVYARLEGFGVPLPKTNARQWRAAKQDWVVRKHGPIVAAKVMGHTLDTALKAYSNGTEAAHRAEMGAFLASVEKTVLRAGERPTDAIDSAVGICTDFQHPSQLSNAISVIPDCRTSEGCLFCDKYRVHADETDARKLLSCRHCVRLTSNRVTSMEEYDQSFGAVLRRIEFLLDELRKRDAAAIREIERDVDINGNLDPFWAAKYEQLFELGLA